MNAVASHCHRVEKPTLDPPMPQRPLSPVPFLRWFPMPMSVLRADVIAGTSLGLLLVPQAMAYAQLAGLPPQYGLYAAVLPVIVGALFGWCGPLNTGPAAMTALLTAAVLSRHADPGSERYIALAALLALLVGVVRILLALVRAAALVNVLSHPVLVGFTAAAAAIIGLSQIDLLLGVPPTARTANFLGDVITSVAALPAAHLATLAMGLGSVLALVVLRLRFRRLPGLLIVAALTTGISWACGYAAAGGAVIGPIARGLPPLTMPIWDWGIAWELLPSALWVTVIGFLEVVTIAKAGAARTREPLHLDQDLLGQGAAAIAAGFSQGFPVSGSLNRSAANLAAGAVTGMSSIVAALVVLATVLLAAPLLYHLPLSMLAAAVLVSVLPLLDVAALRRAWRIHAHDGLAGVITCAATLVLAPRIVEGLLIGAALSVALFLYRTMRPRVSILAQHPDGTLRDAARHDLEPREDVVILRFDGRLYFANVTWFERAALDALAARPRCRWLLIAGDGINEIDASGDEALRRLARQLADSGIGMAMYGLKAQITDVLDRSGATLIIGTDNLFRTADTALAAVEQRLRAALDPASNSNRNVPTS